MSDKVSIDKKDDKYGLLRGGREQIRLTAQHYVLTSRQGWMLHPQISEAIKAMPQPQIADMATGTGIWATELARQMPHAKISGLDISEEQFCPGWTVPTNVSFSIFNLLEEVPAELVGAFDVVHVRLLLTAAPLVGKTVFLQKFHKMLRPGGWLQWDELSFPNMVAYQPSSDGYEMINLEDYPMVKASAQHIGAVAKLECINRFEKVLAEVGGFEKGTRHIIPVQPYLLQMESDLTMAVITDFIELSIVKQAITDPERLDRMRGTLNKMYTDAASGWLFSYSWNVCIGQKVSSE